MELSEPMRPVASTVCETYFDAVTSATTNGKSNDGDDPATLLATTVPVYEPAGPSVTVGEASAPEHEGRIDRIEMTEPTKQSRVVCMRSSGGVDVAVRVREALWPVPRDAPRDHRGLRRAPTRRADVLARARALAVVMVRGRD